MIPENGDYPATPKSVHDPKYCANDGCLAACDDWVPDHLSDYSSEYYASSIGCNRIFCSKCGQFVRQRRGYQFDYRGYPHPESRAAALYATEDWKDLTFVMPSPHGCLRLYYCACNMSNNQWTMPLDGTNDHLIYGASYPPSWHCNGHLPLAFPTEFYGVSLKKSKDVIKVILAVMEHREVTRDPLESKEVNREAFLINRFYALLDAEDHKALIDKMMGKFLSHSDSLYRSVACKFLERFPASKAASKLAAVYRKNPELYDAVLHPRHELGTYPDMVWRLIGLDQQFHNALLAYLKYSQSPGAQKLLRRLILGGKMKANWGRFNDFIGTNWIDKNFEKIYRANPMKNLQSLLQTQERETPQSIRLRIHRLKSLQLISEKEFSNLIPYGIENLMRSSK
jgi:hypothetical protein